MHGQWRGFLVLDHAAGSLDLNFEQDYFLHVWIPGFQKMCNNMFEGIGLDTHRLTDTLMTSWGDAEHTIDPKHKHEIFKLQAKCRL